MSTFCVDNAVFLNSQTLLKPPAATQGKKEQVYSWSRIKNPVKIKFLVWNWCFKMRVSFWSLFVQLIFLYTLKEN
jgi:hypothetical protein